MKLRSRIVVGALLILVAVNGAVASTSASPASVNSYLISHYGSVASSPISTGILYDLTVPFSQISKYDGSDSSAAASLDQWRQMAFELKHASLTENGLPSYQVFSELGRANAAQHIYPIAILNFLYQKIRSDVNPDSVFYFNGTEITSVNENAFTERRAFAASALHTTTYRGNAVRFHMDMNSLYYTNDSHPLRKLQINFDDGAGFRDAPESGDMTAHYSTTGSKYIQVRAVQSDGVPLHTRFRFEVRTLDTPNPTDTWTIQATVPFNGTYGTGQAYIYLADGHSVLTRPVVVSEGFDLDNTMNWDELYALLNQQNLLETLRSLGYDAVVLNYTDATSYIETNGFVMEALLNQVNQTVGNGHAFTLVGPSMGGLTTRYALDYMETNQIPHHVRTLLTFDAPHKGANIPLGIQYWVDFFSSQSSDAALLRDILNTPAAREMLIAHFATPPSSTPGSDPLRAAFLSNIAQLGDLPTQPRLVALANGSGTMQGVGFSPGAQLIRYEYSSFLVDITGNLWALNNSQSQMIFNGIINRIWPFPDDNESVTVQATLPWDNAPGGLRNSMQEMDSVAVPYGDVIALWPNHCFIPTISALDLDVSDPFYNIAGDPNLYSHTPFDSLYYPTQNQDHVEVTPENFWWLINEICDSLSTPQVVASWNNGSVRLSWPPVTAARSYSVFASTDPDVWTGNYQTVVDTTWMDADTTSVSKYYRVIASTALPAQLVASKR